MPPYPLIKRRGALPSQVLSHYIDIGIILNGKKEQLNPSSLDLTLTHEVYRVNGMVLPHSHETIRSLLENVDYQCHDIRYPLERDVFYIARLSESLQLPMEIHGYCNPKSSTGRTDVHVRVLADGVARYDTISGGKQRELWLLIIPKSFPILLAEGEQLSQLRLFNGKTWFDELELEISLNRDKLLWKGTKENEAIRYHDISISDNDGSLILTLDANNDIVGWECLGSNSVFDFSRRNFYQPHHFFSPVYRKEGIVRFRRGGFYILYTRERVRVPPHLACEMVPVDERSGEFRSHYAGFIDPGWGWGARGEGRGRKLVLEVRPNEDILIRDHQPIAKIRFEYMAEIPTVIYDTKFDSNYTYETQVPKLSKHFLMSDT